MDFKPMFDRVLIDQDTPETVTKSGFIIPDMSVEKANTGRIMAVGPGRTTKDGVLIPVTVQVDDRIMFMPGAGVKVKVNGTDMIVLKEEDIIALVEE